ncbi:MAG: metal ABC transporter ATP-binding protein, partial [Alphaproteobacteria bacterium]|nr:metal ABC transporter ATP-binding protein [Alphaproteobacteria bacterium]
LDVVAMGLYGKIGWLGRITGKHKQTALEQLDRVGLAEFADRQIGRLSGGQQQRVFLARALAQDAQVYLMDEPFSGVDAATERAILATLEDLQKAGRTVIVVHHDLDTVAEYFDHALVLNVRKIGDGAVTDALSPDILRQAYGGRLATAHLPDLARAG